MRTSLNVFDLLTQVKPEARMPLTARLCGYAGDSQAEARDALIARGFDRDTAKLIVMADTYRMGAPRLVQILGEGMAQASAEAMAVHHLPEGVADLLMPVIRHQPPPSLDRQLVKNMSFALGGFR